MSKKLNVLFIDDEENILNSIKRTFINEDYGIATTIDPTEAMDIIEKENIKVVLSDQRMPKITGVEFLKKVKERNPDIIRILFTGYAEIQAAEDAINIGQVYRFINKPWNVSELKAAVERAIQHFDLITENRTLFDETKRKNEQLEESNKKLQALYETQKAFTSTVSHELRTPLASIKTAIDLVVQKTVGEINTEQEEVLGRAKKNVDRLRRLIDDILDLTKMESGKLKMNFMQSNINTVIEEVTEAQKDVAESKGLYLKAKLNENIPQVPFDSDRLVQVLSNLLNNAIKFTKEGGVTIVSEDKAGENHIVVSIHDTGKGIAEEDVPNLFEKFQQIESVEEVEEGGTGLGLAICKEIIHRHGGKIWVESKLNEGSTFKFILPIEERRAC